MGSTIEILPGDTFLVTGQTTDGRRFRRDCGNNYRLAMGINLWRGSKWLVRNGKRTRIESVWN